VVALARVNSDVGQLLIGALSYYMDMMKKLLLAFVSLIALVGLSVGITIYLRHRNRQTNRPWAANPCPSGLASVDNTLQPTLKIDLLETNCENDVAAVHFNVTNAGTTPYKSFYVRAIYTYDDYVEDGAEFGTGPLVTGQSTEGFIGLGTPHFGNGKQLGQLRSITLIPSSLEFPDGTKWRRPSVHEPTPK
jgi:hypothetical protein